MNQYGKPRYDAMLAYQSYIVDGKPWVEVSRAIWPGVPPKNTLKARLYLDRHYKLPTEPTEPVDQVTVTETNGKQNYVIITHKQIKSLDDLTALLQFDPLLWAVERWTCKAYEGFFKNKPTQHAQVVQMFSVAATLKQVKGGSIARAEINSLREQLHKEIDSRPQRIITPITFTPSKNGLLLEHSSADIHFGKHAWGHELNGEDYDLAITDKMYRELITRLIEMSVYQPYEKVLFVLGNDFFNSDNTAGTTFSGTPQDNDGRHKKVYQVGKAAAIWAIEQFAQIAPVLVLSIPGNHDTETIYYLADTIETHFRNTKYVEVDNTPSSRKYVRFTNCLLGFSHGDKGKATDYPALMANERPKDFGETKYHEFHIGHRHQDRVERGEYHGFKVRTVPSPTATDLWHFDNGFTCNIRSGVNYIFDRQQGYRGEHFHAVVPDPKTITVKSSVVL